MSSCDVTGYGEVLVEDDLAEFLGRLHEAALGTPMENQAGSYEFHYSECRQLVIDQMNNLWLLVRQTDLMPLCPFNDNPADPEYEFYLNCHSHGFDAALEHLSESSSTFVLLDEGQARRIRSNALQSLCRELDKGPGCFWLVSENMSSGFCTMEWGWLGYIRLSQMIGDEIVLNLNEDWSVIGANYLGSSSSEEKCQSLELEFLCDGNGQARSVTLKGLKSVELFLDAKGIQIVDISERHWSPWKYEVWINHNYPFARTRFYAKAAYF